MDKFKKLISSAGNAEICPIVQLQVDETEQDVRNAFLPDEPIESEVTKLGTYTDLPSSDQDNKGVKRDEHQPGPPCEIASEVNMGVSG